MKHLLFSMVLFACCCSCMKTNTDAQKKELLAVDLAFSDSSLRVGNHLAFLAFMDETGVLLRDNSDPVQGINEIKKLFAQKSDSGYRLTWNPLYADISSSGDLGYTYGTYELRIDTNIINGTYATIWKKNKEGKWKFVLDTGNEGLGKK